MLSSVKVTIPDWDEDMLSAALLAAVLEERLSAGRAVAAGKGPPVAVQVRCDASLHMLFGMSGAWICCVFCVGVCLSVAPSSSFL